MWYGFAHIPYKVFETKGLCVITHQVKLQNACTKSLGHRKNEKQNKTLRQRATEKHPKTA